MAFSEVKPGDTVLELVPGSGYWTRAFSGIVGPSGKLYLPVPAQMEQYSAATKTLPGQLSTADLLEPPAAALPPPNPVHLLFTPQNYHPAPLAYMGPPAPVAATNTGFAPLCTV